MTNPEVLRIAKIFFDDATTSKTLRQIVEDHGYCKFGLNSNNAYFWGS